MSSVRPRFLSFSMLFVIDPLALVLGSIGMCVLSKAVSLVVLPITVVDVTISVDQSSSAIGHVPLPVSFVDRAIRPNLNSSTMSLIGVNVPLPSVLSTIGQGLGIAVLQPDSVVDVLLLLVKSVLEWW